MRLPGLMILLLLTAFHTSAVAGQSRQPNFLFIAIDDLNTHKSVMGDNPSSFLRKVLPGSPKAPDCYRAPHA